MIKYVLKNFRRRKVRTILMVLSLMVSTGRIVARSATVETIRRSNVDLVSSSTGHYDLSVQRRETSPEPFIAVAETSRRILAANDRITAVFPRFASADFSRGGLSQTARWPGLMIPATLVLFVFADWLNQTRAG